VNDFAKFRVGRAWRLLRAPPNDPLAYARLPSKRERMQGMAAFLGVEVTIANV